jgi:hypothetical protein
MRQASQLRVTNGDIEPGKLNKVLKESMCTHNEHYLGETLYGNDSNDEETVTMRLSNGQTDLFIYIGKHHSDKHECE